MDKWGHVGVGPCHVGSGACHVGTGLGHVGTGQGHVRTCDLVCDNVCAVFLFVILIMSQHNTDFFLTMNLTRLKTTLSFGYVTVTFGQVRVMVV